MKIFNYNKKLFRWDSNQYLTVLGNIISENNTRYAHYRFPSKIFCEVSTQSLLTINVTDERKYFESNTGHLSSIIFVYLNNNWTKNGQNVNLSDWGISITGTPQTNNSFTVTLTDTVSVRVLNNNTVPIPNRLLQFYGDFKVYAYTVFSDGSKTYECDDFYIEDRPIPPEYIYDPTEVVTYPNLVNLVNSMAALQSSLSTWEVSLIENGGLPSGEAIVEPTKTKLKFYNIRTSAGVITVNGESGNVVLTGDDIAIGDGIVDTIHNSFNSLNNSKESISNKVSIISSSPNITRYPNELAVKDYVDSSIRAIRTYLHSVYFRAKFVIYQNDYGSAFVLQQIPLLIYSSVSVPFTTLSLSSFLYNAGYRTSGAIGNAMPICTKQIEGYASGIGNLKGTGVADICSGNGEDYYIHTYTNINSTIYHLGEINATFISDQVTQIQ